MRNAFLIGERIYLRPVEPGDRDRYLQWLNDPEVNRYLLLCRPLGQAEEEAWIAGAKDRADEINLAIVLKEQDRHIGGIGLRGISLPNRRADFGISIGEKECWNQGLGREAIRLLLDYGFNRLGLHRIELNVYAYNRRGIRCYEQCGFRFEGALREGRYFDGRFHDILLYGILEHEFRASAEGPEAGRAGHEPRLACLPVPAGDAAGGRAGVDMAFD